MKSYSDLTNQERRVLLQIHLQGWINWGPMKKPKRLEMLNNLIERGYLKEKSIELTNKAHLELQE